MQRIRATIQGFSGAPGVITLYTLTSLPEDATSAQLCADRLGDALTAGNGLYAQGVSFVSDTFVDTIDPATGTITASDSITPWTVTSSSTASTAPPMVQGCITWKTNDVVAGRRVAGRTFIGPVALDMLQNDGTPSSTAMTKLEAIGAAWQDNGTTDVYAAVWHRPVSGAGGSDHEITAHSIRDKWAVLRSRRD